MAEKIQLTQEEKDYLLSRRNYIQSVEKPNVEKELDLARSQGDLSENADYDAALEKNQGLQNELNTINAQLDNCIVPVHKKDCDYVQFGDTVTFLHMGLKKNLTYTIGGLTDLDKKKIDYKSLVAEALMGHKVGDIVLVKVAKPYKAKIVKIAYNG